MKKTLLPAVLTAAAMILTLPAYAAESHEQAVSDFPRNSIGLPEGRQTETLKTAVWNGKTKLAENTCYFVEGKTTLTKSFTLPQSSMLVVRSGAKLTVKNGRKLNINGTAVVQSGAVLNIVSGKLVIKASGALVTNGKLAVSKNGGAYIYGYAQGSPDSEINIKGTISVKKGGELVTASAPKYYKGAKKSGTSRAEIITSSDRPRYYVEELTRYSDGKMMFDAGGGTKEIADPDMKQKLIDTLESAVYRYSGEIELPDNNDALEYVMDIQHTENGVVYFINGSDESPHYGWQSDFKAFYTLDLDKNEISGCYYSVVLGCADGDLFDSAIKYARS